MVKPSGVVPDNLSLFYFCMKGNLYWFTFGGWLHVARQHGGHKVPSQDYVAGDCSAGLGLENPVVMLGWEAPLSVTHM